MPQLLTLCAPPLPLPLPLSCLSAWFLQQGIHTASAVWNTDVDQRDWPVQNGFAVQEVIDMIKAHNKEVLRK